jgi:hypothetical protein
MLNPLFHIDWGVFLALLLFIVEKNSVFKSGEPAW